MLPSSMRLGATLALLLLCGCAVQGASAGWLHSLRLRNRLDATQDFLQARQQARQQRAQALWREWQSLKQQLDELVGPQPRASELAPAAGGSSSRLVEPASAQDEQAPIHRSLAAFTGGYGYGGYGGDYGGYGYGAEGSSSSATSSGSQRRLLAHELGTAPVLVYGQEQERLAAVIAAGAAHADAIELPAAVPAREPALEQRRAARRLLLAAADLSGSAAGLVETQALVLEPQDALLPGRQLLGEGGYGYGGYGGDYGGYGGYGSARRLLAEGEPGLSDGELYELWLQHNARGQH